MAVSPLQWNPIRADFGDATGMMQSAGQSIGRATDTVSNIINQNREAERQKLAQDHMLKQRDMEQGRLDIARAREGREEETYRIESEGSVLGTNFYEDFSKKRQENPQLTPQEYIAGKDVEGVDLRVFDVGLNNFVKKVKEDQDLVNTSFDTAKKRREAETYKAIKDSDINFYAPEEEVIAKANELPTEARDAVIKTYLAIEKSRLELEELERRKGSRVSKEQVDSIASAYYNPNTKPEERIDILTSAMLLHKDDSEAVGVFYKMLSTELQSQGIKAARAEALSKSFNASTKDLDKDIQNSQKGAAYYGKEYKDYNIHRDGVAELDKISRALYDPETKVGVGADQLVSVLASTGNLNKRWVFWGSTLHNRDAHMEVTRVGDLIIDDKGTSIINKEKPLGKILINTLKNNAITKGIDPDSVAIIKNTDNYFGNKGGGDGGGAWGGGGGTGTGQSDKLMDTDPLTRALYPK